MRELLWKESADAITVWQEVLPVLVEVIFFIKFRLSKCEPLHNPPRLIHIYIQNLRSGLFFLLPKLKFDHNKNENLAFCDKMVIFGCISTLVGLSLLSLFYK
jgi:hypothetical protein